jgi:hypothetical protein
VVVALGAWTGCFLAQQLADARWAAAVRPRRGLLLELARPGGMPQLSHGLMEMGYTQHYSPAGRDSAAAFAAYGSALAEGEAAEGEGSEAGAGGDAGITFTATTSAAGTLLVGSSRWVRGCWRALPGCHMTTRRAAPAASHALNWLPASTRPARRVTRREFAGYSADAPEPVVHAIMERAAKFLPGLAGVRRQDISVRAGPRPYATVGRCRGPGSGSGALALPGPLL